MIRLSITALRRAILLGLAGIMHCLISGATIAASREESTKGLVYPPISSAKAVVSNLQIPSATGRTLFDLQSLILNALRRNCDLHREIRARKIERLRDGRAVKGKDEKSNHWGNTAIAA